MQKGPTDNNGVHVQAIVDGLGSLNITANKLMSVVFVADHCKTLTRFSDQLWID